MSEDGVPLGPYVLLRRLAKGGMAEIFLARKEGPDGFARELVVKRVLPQLSSDPELMALFREEAKIVARLSHPNIVQVYDFGETDGNAYLVMELIRGVDLRNLTHRAKEVAEHAGLQGAVPPHHAAKILSFVCEGLAHAHELKDANGETVGLVHRDVTPSNVLISFEGAVKVADFGIAKLENAAPPPTDSDRPKTGIRGKYPYLSPEQSRGEDLDRRSDIFNVGILLFEMVTGDHLYPHDDPYLSRKWTAAGTIPGLDRFAQMPRELRRIALKAMSASRSDRYPDAIALRAELEAYVRQQEEASDAFELGQWVRALFPDALAEDRQAPRAAGTLPLHPAPPDLKTVALRIGLGVPSVAATSDSVEAEAKTEPALPKLLANPMSPETTDSTREAPRSKGRTQLLLVAAVSLLVAGAGAVWRWNSRADEAAPPRIDAAPPVGTLAVDTSPTGLDVYVNGERRGAAPLDLPLAAGRYQVSLANEQSRREVRVSTGARIEVTLRHTPRPRLHIESTPSGANVFIDDNHAGETPLDVESTEGSHILRVERRGFVSEQSTVAVPAEGVAMLSLELRADSLRRAPPPSVTPSPLPAAPEPQRIEPPRQQRFGRLAISTQPWCEVFLGNRRLGTTPLANVPLSEGTHTLTLRSPGRPDRQHQVTIVAEQESRVRLSL